jgi:chromosome segregation ATPase
MSANYGFMQSENPNQARIVAVDISFILDSPELLGKVFSLQSEVKQASRTNLVAKIETTEQEWEQARIVAVDLRTKRQQHRQRETSVRNDYLQVQNKLDVSMKQLSAWRNASLDVLASKQERAARLETIKDYENAVAHAEREAITANAMWNSYVYEAERLTEDWNKAQATFASVDGELNRLRQQLGEIEAQN